MLKKIVYCVLVAHLALVLFVAVAVKQKPSFESMPIAVKTYTLPKPAPPKKTVKSQKKKPARKKASDVMQDLQKNIAKIEKKKDVKPGSPKGKSKQAPANKKTVPAPPEEKHKIQYPVLLVQKLKSALHLPEKGDVRLEVTLKNSGEVIEVKVLSSKSPDNATYLQAEIPKMRFPVFSGELVGKKQHTFTLTFCHDD